MILLLFTGTYLDDLPDVTATVVVSGVLTATVSRP